MLDEEASFARGLWKCCEMWSSSVRLKCSMLSLLKVRLPCALLSSNGAKAGIHCSLYSRKLYTHTAPNKVFVRITQNLFPNRVSFAVIVS